MTALPDALAAYFETRQQDRARDVEDALAAMNPRELRLVREAAVMGYVQGSMASGGITGGEGRRAPRDSETLFRVVDACLGFADLYPTMSRMLRTGRRRKAVAP